MVSEKTAFAERNFGNYFQRNWGRNTQRNYGKKPWRNFRIDSKSNTLFICRRNCWWKYKTKCRDNAQRIWNLKSNIETIHKAGEIPNVMNHRKIRSDQLRWIHKSIPKTIVDESSKGIVKKNPKALTQCQFLKQMPKYIKKYNQCWKELPDNFLKKLPKKISNKLLKKWHWRRSFQRNLQKKQTA